MIHGRHIRAARALLNMKQSELAEAAGISHGGLKKIEAGRVKPREKTMAAILEVLAGRGIEFLDHRGSVFVGFVWTC